MTKLKCKKCKLFYVDDGSILKCDKCGGSLKRITVHTINPKNVSASLKVTTKFKKGAKDDKYKKE